MEQSAKDEDTFHRAIGPVLFTAQLFGTFPVAGVLRHSRRRLRARYLHWTLLPFLFVSAVTSFELFSCIRKELSAGITLNSSAEIIFLSVNLSGGLLMFRLTRDWPRTADEWHRAEEIFLRPPYARCRPRLRLRLRLVAFSMLAVAAVEHLLYLSSALYKNLVQIRECHLSVGVLENFFRTERSHIFSFFPFTWWLATASEYANIAQTFCWSFVDVLISMLSVALAARFAQLNDRLEMARGRRMPEDFWAEMRLHYNRLVELVCFVDGRVAGLVVLSCLSNMYFVCFLVFNSINKPPLLISRIYQFSSLAFIILRTLITMFLTARIHDHALQPTMILANVPASCWSADVERFVDQLHNDVVALSGKRFFFITRRLMLGMIGTIATYELVLLNSVDRQPHKVYSCNGTNGTA